MLQLHIDVDNRPGYSVAIGKFLRPQIFLLCLLLPHLLTQVQMNEYIAKFSTYGLESPSVLPIAEQEKNAYSTNKS